MGRKGLRRHSKVIWPGFNRAPLPRQIAKVGRNDPCPCGADKKYKDCHESEGSAYLEKIAFEEHKVRVREIKLQMKERGVSWWRRWLYRG